LNLKKFLVIAILVLVAILGVSDANAQTPTSIGDIATRINRERIARGLTPYAVNAQLTQAAQAHANDIASSGKFGHTGTDGSTVFDRVARTGYGAYSWGRRLGENWAWYPSAERAMTFWMDSPDHRNNILHALYREIGIGIAASQGNLVIVVDFGAQPNVLPFFINNYDSETKSPDVSLRFSSEDVVSVGEGAGTIGIPTQIQISNNADFAGAIWQSFAKQIQWTLTMGDGVKTVYVKYRDARGRMATANDSITLNQSGDSAPRAAVGAAPVQVKPGTDVASTTPSITRTATRTVTPTMTRTVSSTISVIATASPTWTPTTTMTSTPEPTATMTSTPSAVSTNAPVADNANNFFLSIGGLGLLVGVLGTARYLAERFGFDD
jgi:hypothetical protein